MDGLRALGAEIRQEGDALRVTGCRPEEAEAAVIPCRESGSTLRFLLPLCLLNGREMLLTGSGRLLSRPLDVYETLCRERGFRLERTAEGIRVQGRLEPGNYTVRGDLSSQFLTGLLYALSLLPEESRIRILPPIESEPYLRMTLEAMADAGISVGRPGHETLAVPGGGRYRNGDKSVEGDWSNAAFFEALRQAGHPVRITGLREDSLQGDKICREYFRRTGSGCDGLPGPGPGTDGLRGNERRSEAYGYEAAALQGKRPGAGNGRGTGKVRRDGHGRGE